jgi:hypothetical protein
MRFCALCCYIEATTATNKRLKIIIMKISQALKEAAKTQDAPRMQRLINQMNRSGKDVMAIPFLCAVNLVGLKAHRWAWDQLENWQDA